MSALITVIARVLLSVVYTVGYFVTLYLFITGRTKIDADMAGLVTTVLGVMTAGQGYILAFWFGSSQGSALKTDIIAKAQPVQ